MSLNNEITKHRAEIRSDAYSMSVGELINMYRDTELHIRPQFQRLFRWSQSQKSRFIESILLGIPIPSIFVYQRPDGVWDVIDGQQRLSTIFEFVGILKDQDGKLRDPLALVKTKFLPSLQDRLWSDQDPSRAIGRDNHLLIKRSKLDVKIILRESSEASKYELFQRLNTGGSLLSRQEIRNVIILMIDSTCHDWVADLATSSDFKDCTDLTDRQLEEQYDRELIIRFLTLGGLPDTDFHIGDLGDFLDDKAEELATNKDLDRDTERLIFAKTFQALKNYGPNVFKRYDHAKGMHSGGFLISAFEVFAIGLSYHFRQDIDNVVDPAALGNVAKGIWRDERFLGAIGSGVRASSRIPKIVPYARQQLRECLSEHS